LRIPFSSINNVSINQGGKRVKLKLYLFGFLALFSAGLFSACGGGGGEAGTGNLSLWLTDAATPDYKAVYVTIEEVRVHQPEGEWKTVASPGKTYNLLELMNGVTEQLGVSELSSGKYTQMRLLIGDIADDGQNLLQEIHPFANYVVDGDGNYQELKVPSGMQSGYKLVGGFTIATGKTTGLLLDFDAARSVVKPGASGKWLLKPTVKVLAMESLGGAEGTVTDVQTALALEGATVSAQNETSEAVDPRDAVTTTAATVSNSEGAYYLFLEPGTFNLVASREGYESACARLTVAAEATVSADFALIPAATVGTVTGAVSIAGGDSESTATLSFRQALTCGEESRQVEAVSTSIAAGGSYHIVLPTGSYNLVVAVEGAETQEHDLEVAADNEIFLDLTM
jgi:hypothetical protein